MIRAYGRNPNHQRVKFYEFGGERRTILGWAQRFGLTYTCVQSRLKQGTPLDAPKSARGRKPLAGESGAGGKEMK